MSFFAIVASLLLLPFFLVVIASAIVVYYTDFGSSHITGDGKSLLDRRMLWKQGVQEAQSVLSSSLTPPNQSSLRLVSFASLIPTTIAIMGLSLVLFLPIIVPVDVFAAEREVRIGDFIRDLYFCTVAALYLFIFFLGPFAFFFYRGGDSLRQSNRQNEDGFRSGMEETDNDCDEADGFNPPPPLVTRACLACRQTWMCVCVFSGLLVGAIVLHASVKASQEQHDGMFDGGGMNVAYDTVNSIQKLFKSPDTGTFFLHILVAASVLIGMCGIIVYTALGFVSLPVIGCMRLGWRGMRAGLLDQSSAQEDSTRLNEAALWRERIRLNSIAEVEAQRSANTRERRHLYSKYGITSRVGRMPKGAKKRSAELEARQIALSERLERLQEDLVVHAVGIEYGIDSSPTRLVNCWFESVRRLKGLYHALKIPLGFLSIGLSVALWVATFVTCWNKFLASSFSRGYVIHDHSYEGQFYNPVDHFLRILAIAYPLDLVFIACIVMYSLVATIYGISALGIRVCCLHVHSLRRRRTPPSGMILFVGNLIFVMIAMTCHVLWIVPQYSTFGAQMYVDPRSQEIVPCSLIGVVFAESDASAMIPHRVGEDTTKESITKRSNLILLQLHSDVVESPHGIVNQSRLAQTPPKLPPKLPPKQKYDKATSQLNSASKPSAVSNANERKPKGHSVKETAKKENEGNKVGRSRGTKITTYSHSDIKSLGTKQNGKPQARKAKIVETKKHDAPKHESNKGINLTESIQGKDSTDLDHITTNVNDDEDGLREIDEYVEEVDGERQDKQPHGNNIFGGFVTGGIEGHTPMINGTTLVKLGACNPTELSILFNTVFVHYPIFGAAMQWLTVIYLISFSILFVVTLRKDPEQPWTHLFNPYVTGDIDYNEFDVDENEETFGLLWSESDSGGSDIVGDE